MIGIILALLVGIGLMVGIMNYSSTVGAGTNVMLQQISIAIYKGVYMFFTWIVLLTPLFALVIPIYLAYNRNRLDSKVLIFSGIYGIAIYYILIQSGVYTYIVDYFTTAYHASFITLTPIREIAMLIWSYLHGLVGYLTDNRLVRKLRGD